MKLLNTFLKYAFLVISIVACQEDDEASTTTSATIKDLSFVAVSVDDTGRLVGVTPTSTGGTNTIYTVDFGDGNATSNNDVKLTSGPQVTYQYPATSATYTITVTAKAEKSTSISLTKSYTVTFEPPTSIADFENEADLNLRNDTSGTAATIAVAVQTDSQGNASNVGVVNNVGASYEGVSVNLSKHISVASKSVITLDYYQTTSEAVEVLLKLETAKTANAFDIEVKATTAASTGWQTLTFDFGKKATNSYPNNENTEVTLDEYQKLVVFIGFGVELSGTFYIDNIAGGTLGSEVPDTDNDGLMDSVDDCKTVAGIVEKNGCPLATSPTIAAPTPMMSPNNVISLFSDAYTNILVDTWRTDWSSGNYAEATVASNNVKNYNAMGFVGIETTGGNLLDASAMTHVHMDVWSENATEFGLKIVDFGADQAYDGGDDVEGVKTITNFTKGAWVSFDFPLADFSGLTDKVNLAQYILTAKPDGVATVYIDNFYFYKQ